MQKQGVISLGEALIDFIPLDEQDEMFQKCPGGAPANVAVGLARLGLASTFAGKLGDDVLGRYLKDTLKAFGVNTNEIVLTNEAKTAIVFVTLGEDGERSFEFYINPSADQLLNPEDLQESLFTSHRVLHFGSISMIHPEARRATTHAIERAKANGLFISFDPNVRLGLWESEEECRERILQTLNEAHLVKVSEEEVEFLTGEAEISAGVAKLKDYSWDVLVVTKGAAGSEVFTKHEHRTVSAEMVEAVDTTGAGDAFVSALLYKAHEHPGGPTAMTADDWAEAARTASLSGGMAAATKGAMTALPTIQQLEDRQEERS
ncbi:fructokinase [Salsuginibacillus halophilus]|uniref:Fructokinase n=1 Tax=Salsuginibacillus halophilus TaxID=517424 RepID=A0A2P8HEE2_9BACI|nr:fructokinase [Salsuginibacillus halophilus]